MEAPRSILSIPAARGVPAEPGRRLHAAGGGLAGDLVGGVLGAIPRFSQWTQLGCTHHRWDNSSKDINWVQSVYCLHLSRAKSACKAGLLVPASVIHEGLDIIFMLLLLITAVVGDLKLSNSRTGERPGNQEKANRLRLKEILPYVIDVYLKTRSGAMRTKRQI